ncbi:MAG: hypothetical protein ACI8RZ_002285 [Myxococcota bacterium]
MIALSTDQAFRLLLRSTGLTAPSWPSGRGGALSVLRDLTCIQIDPIDRVGTSPDLVLHARVDGIKRGDWANLQPLDAFEHFAKERCLLPASAFPYYRDQAAETPWWRLTQRLKRIDVGLLDAVLAEVTERGPLAAGELSDRGQVTPIDWSGWKSTAKAASMAAEVLWIRCQVVTTGRDTAGRRIYDIPARALPAVADKAPDQPFLRWALLSRVKAAGLLRVAGGPQWSMLSGARGTSLVADLVAANALVEVRVTGSRRGYLALPAALEGLDTPPPTDRRMRIIGPLDPLIWDRPLIQHTTGFEYLWEVYKPAAKRRWGYYVCPLLYRGRLVGRIEAKRVEGSVVVENLWKEKGWSVGMTSALDRAVARLSTLQ